MHSVQHFECVCLVCDSTVHELSFKTFKWKFYHNLLVKHCAHALPMWNSSRHNGLLTDPHWVSPWCAPMSCSRKHKSTGRLDIFGSHCLIIAEMAMWHLFCSKELSSFCSFKSYSLLKGFQVSRVRLNGIFFFCLSLQTLIPCLFIKMNGEKFRFLVLNQNT